MDDVKIVLEELKADSESGKQAAPAAGLRERPRRLRWLTAAGAVLVAAGVGAVVWFGRSEESAAPAPLMRLTSDTGLTTDPALSPDGARLAFVTGAGGLSGGGRRGLLVIPSLGGTPQPRVSDAVGAARPVWSPDGTIILSATGQYRPGNWGLVLSEPGAQAPPIILRLEELKKTDGLADLVPYDWMARAGHQEPRMGSKVQQLARSPATSG